MIQTIWPFMEIVIIFLLIIECWILHVWSKQLTLFIKALMKNPTAKDNGA